MGSPDQAVFSGHQPPAATSRAPERFLAPCRRGAKDERQVVFDRPRVTGAECLPVPRIPDLEGMRLGVLDDTTWSANRLLRKTAQGSPARRTGRAPEFRSVTRSAWVAIAIDAMLCSAYIDAIHNDAKRLYERGDCAAAAGARAQR
jgi:hypothetical protein